MKKIYFIDFLVAPKWKDLYFGEITEYADRFVCLPVEDLDLAVRQIEVIAEDQQQAVKKATRKLYNENKGQTFELIGVRWYSRG